MFKNREDFLSMNQFNDFLSKFSRNQEAEKRNKIFMWIGISITAVAVIAGIAYAVYRYLNPTYLEDFDEDFDLDYDDDDFEDLDYDDTQALQELTEEIEETMMENEIKE
ncbi:hypothetical protein EDC19_1699 [Natranaerovirga hydrolytica]|uniref:DUF4366 domain-containing protein n=1 Tax=Natranaerovirga hydrolytica TaxID=680378 RepID=A0A4R1MJE6_9FIRM|nr:hypothetical protein [Natranaerovirga hydrolytica]TCK92555.1 hypothetical protein EDC19_1699 [Natranaerovirga hydrolytica]